MGRRGDAARNWGRGMGRGGESVHGVERGGGRGEGGRKW
jgi:hypothetical protein